MKLAIVIPAHNEEEIIAQTIKGIEDKLKLDYEIIVVNDHSTDKTASVVNELFSRYSNVRLVDNDTGRGFAAALKKGFSAATADFVVPVMADLCDDPLTIQDMYKKALEGFDVVCGSRYTYGGGKHGGPAMQSFFSRFVGKSLQYFIGIPTCDVSNSFKCYRKQVLDALRIESDAFEISMEIALKAYFKGFKIAEVATVWKGRFMGKSTFYIIKVAPSYIKWYLWALFNPRAGLLRRRDRE